MTPRQIFQQNIAQTTPFPMQLEVERAAGSWLFGKNGEKWLDLISGISVSSVGHCHPKVVEAIQNQAAKAMHLMVYGEYIYAPQTELAQKLTEILPHSLDNFYFTNSGTEAVEGALKLAKRYTKRFEIISFKNAYHGSTAGALSAMGSDEYKSAFRPLIPNHTILEYNNLEEIDKITTQTAAVLVEMVQAESGIHPGNVAFIQKLADKCRQTNTLFIADEIQTGIGRTGKLFAFEHFGIVPDVLLIGKAFGGGMPIAAFIANKNIMTALSQNPILGHISTFAGNPVCCAAALATLNVVLVDRLAERAEKMGKKLADILRKEISLPIRQIGMMIAIDHKNMEANFQFCKKLWEKGVVVDWFLFNAKSTRIGPPLNISETDLEWAAEKLIETYRFQYS